MFPRPDVPVVQLSIDRRLDPRSHLELGFSLAELRDEGVLIMGSGNVVHNLHDALKRTRMGAPATPDWARRFDEATKRTISQRDTEGLLSLLNSSDGRLAHPTPEHWLPLLYAYGATDDGDGTQFPTEGFDMGSLSMRNVVFGGRTQR